MPTITALAEAGARVVVTAHLGRPEGRPGPEVLAGPGRPRGSVSCSAAPVAAGRARPTPAAEHGRAATSCCWRTSASTRARPARTTTSAAALADELVALVGADGGVRLRRVRRGAPQAGLGLRRRAAAAGLRRRPGARPRSRCCARSPTTPDRPYAVVLGGSKVSDKLAVIEALLPAGRRAAGRRRDVLHVPGRAGLRRRRLAAGDATRSTPAGGCWSRARSCCPTDVVVADDVLRRREHPHRRASDAIPDGWKGLDIGPDSVAAFAEVLRRRRRRCSGTARWACSRWRRSPRAPAASPQAIIDATADGAFSVVGGGDSAAAVRALGLRRGRLLAHLHRRRRVAGVPGGQGPARRRGPGEG